MNWALILAVALAVLARMFRSVQKGFSEIPARELRRRSAKGDDISHRLYLAARYEGRLRLLLEISIVVSLAFFAYLVFSEAAGGWAIVACFAVIFYLFVLSPNSTVHTTSRRLAAFYAPALAWTLRFLSPLLYLAQPGGYRQPKYPAFYDHQDLVDFLKSQIKVSDSRIPEDDLARAIEALEHRELIVGDVMVKRKAMRLLKEDEEVGPILLSELHSTGQDCFGVIDKSGDIKGVISLGQLVEMKAGGLVKEVMDKDLVYIKNDWLVPKAAAAYLQTKHKIFLTVDHKEKVVGIIGFDTLLSSLLGASGETDGELNYRQASDIAAS